MSYNQQALVQVHQVKATQYICTRDFIEQYDTKDAERAVGSPNLLAALEAMQKNYKGEFERYGVTHLRLEK